VTIVKICGIKTLSDARAAIEAGVDYLGFNFYPPSPRYIKLSVCSKISTVIKAAYPQIMLVGVFVNEPLANIRNVLQTCSLDLAQLHGDEPPERIAQLAPRAFKAFRGAFGDTDAYIRSEAPACLVDAAIKGAYGGTGLTANWTTAARLARQFPIFLAGGLNPDNVAEAVSRVRPWGVDVASGVESAPGVKDEDKMRDFVRAVHSINASELHRVSIPIQMEK
jgi:phosphoribosylanthranilate isomerase